MRHSKKGDLAISTNAIVILIIAVIMLGLIIAFVTKAVGTAGDALLAKAKQLPDPPTPSSSQPLSVTENVLANVDEDFVMKVSVYNPTTAAATISPSVKCADQDLTLASIQVPGKKVGVGIATGKFSTAGLQVCQVTTQIDGETYSRDFTVEVRK